MNKKLQELLIYKAKFTAKYPEVAKNFVSLKESVMNDGQLAAREKELIALGIAVGLHCLPCIHAHTRSALILGATPQAIFEAASLAICMAGKPAKAYISEICCLLEELECE